MKISVWFIALIPMMLFGQDSKKFTPGHVVYANGDTVKGLVANLHKNAHEYIEFKQFYNNKDTTFTPKDIMSYRIGEKNYVSVPFPGVEEGTKFFHFAEILVNGYLTLYKTKLKTDPILPPTEAFLCKKEGKDELVAVGKVRFLLPLVEDDEEVAKIIKTHQFKENESEKIRICKLYNERKK